MAGKYVKPANLKYVDLCIFIDKNFEKAVTGEQDIGLEAKIFEYLYHIVYALSCKQNFFRNFADYDPFSLFAATELYISMRNKQVNAGKEIHGVVVQPVKSCLNYIKSVLFPLKVNYQRQTFATVLDPNLEGKDTSKLKQDMRDNVRSYYKAPLHIDLEELNKQLPRIVNAVVKESPYRPDPLMCSRLRISCQLTLLHDITLPSRAVARIDKAGPEIEDEKLIKFYQHTDRRVIL